MIGLYYVLLILSILLATSLGWTPLISCIVGLLAGVVILHLIVLWIRKLK